MPSADDALEANAAMLEFNRRGTNAVSRYRTQRALDAMAALGRAFSKPANVRALRLPSGKVIERQ